MVFLKEAIRSKLAAIRYKNCLVLEAAYRHSASYARALELTADDLEIIFESRHEKKGFYKFTVDGKRFKLIVERIEEPESKPEYFILIICTDNQNLNSSIKLCGKTLSVLPTEWHRTICQHLAENEIEEQQPRKAQQPK